MTELYMPQATDWIGALEAGQKAGLMTKQRSAAQRAGGLMAGGDYKGAAGELYSAGDFQGGGAIAKAGYEQTEQTDKLGRQQAVKAALDKGDYAGAYAAAGTDADLLGGLDKVASHAKETTATMAAALQALKDPATGQWLPPDLARQKYAAIKPQLVSRGIAQQQLDAFDPTPENLQAIQGQVLGLDKQLEMAKGVTVGNDLLNPYTGAEIHKGRDLKTIHNADGSESLVDATDTEPTASGQPAPVGGAPTQEAPIPTGGIYAQVGQIAAGKGAQPGEVSYVQRLAQVESHGKAGAQNGSSTGLFQFHPDTFAGVGGGDIHNVADQTAAALAISRRDRANLHSLGIEPTDANTYIMHQQGPGGGRALLTAPPEVGAIAALTPVYGNAATAKKAIVNNGGTADMTAGDFLDMWRQRWANGGAPVQKGAPQNPAAQPGGARVVFRGEGIDETSGLDQSDVHLLAGRYLIDGTLPPLGMGKQAAALKQRILHEAGNQAAALGIDAGDLVAGTASTKALSHALSKNMDMQQSVQQFEQTAIKNADLALSLAPKGGAQINVPILDKWVQTGRKAVMGDPAVTQFDVALGTFLDEYAKVTTGATGGTGSTDAARKEAYDRLSKYAAQGQISAGISTMKQEMSNRSDALKEVETGIRTRLRTGGAPLAPATETPAPKAPASDAQPTSAQATKRASFANSKAPAGDAQNPYVPMSEAQYNGLKPGAHYIAQDGSVRIKGG